MVTACLFDKESVMQQYSIWFNSDISSAFDSVSRAALASYVRKMTSSARSLEAARLLQVVTDVSLKCEWQGDAISIEQTKGIQQGAAHSSILFSAILGTLLDELQQQWADRGESNLHGLFLWSYIDDLILCFRDWDQADKLSKQLVVKLKTIGLNLNLQKSKFVSHASLLAARSREDFDEESLVTQCDWETQALFLRKIFVIGMRLRNHPPQIS